MKITVKKKKKKVMPEIDWRKLEDGTVIEFEDGVQGVVHSCGNEILLFNDLIGDDYFEKAIGYKDRTIVKVLGKLTEIIVKEI